jgi:predicted nucleic acid-binding protein
MNVLVDTSVWSEALRRQTGAGREDVIHALEGLIGKGLAVLIGPVRQELLSGIRDLNPFNLLKHKLRGFPDIPVELRDYEYAAELFNTCRGTGIQGSRVDMLICAVALNRNSAVFTLDQDFGHYAKAIHVRLFKWV